MKDKKITNFLKFNKFSFLALFDGLDIFLNLSIITYLSIFFFQDLDNRISILIISFIILLSFFSRCNFFCFIEKILFKFNKENFNLYYAFSIFYFIPFFLIDSIELLSLFIFILCRFFIGNLFYLAKKNYLTSEEFKKENNFFIKYVIIFICGMIIGSFVFTILNDIFSNNDLNNWAWKCSYIFLLAVSIGFGFFLKYKIFLLNLKNNLQLSSSNKNFPFFLKNICLIVPFYLFFIYSSENWLPRFSNPENMQVLDFGIINILLIFLLTIFSFPLFSLIGNKKLNNFVSILVIFISIFAFAFEYSSSYSIDFLKFYLSIISSFVICLNSLNSKQSNDKDVLNYLSLLTLIFIILSLMTPLTFYFFINFSVSYNIIYLIIGILFLTSFLAGKYGERKN